MSIIETKDLYFRYSTDDKAVNGVSISIEKGEYVCILGHNGSGKSTLAKLIVGLLEPKKGYIYINNELLDENSVDRLRSNIGIVFQNPDNQFVGVTVRDDIAFGLENMKVNHDEIIKRIDKYSSIVSMDSFLDRNPEELSGGEKQRVAIAGILAMNPEVIIFDEATSMLDPKGVREIIEIIQNLKHKKTIISITHNLNEAKYADRVIVMNKGKVVLNGSYIDVFKNVEILKESNLDILDSMKLIEMINESNIERKEEIKQALWELSYQK